MAQKEKAQVQEKNGGNAKNEKTKNGDHSNKGHESKSKKEHEIRATNISKEDRKFLEEHSDELGKTTLRARWVHNADEHEERKGQSLATRSPEVIRRWAEDRKAVPATVEGSEHGDLLGVLRFNFPGYGGSSLKEVSWDDWFKTFEDRELVFIFQEHKRDGQMSNFFILDNPNREDG